MHRLFLLSYLLIIKEECKTFVFIIPLFFLYNIPCSITSDRRWHCHRWTKVLPSSDTWSARKDKHRWSCRRYSRSLCSSCIAQQCFRYQGDTSNSTTCTRPGPLKRLSMSFRGAQNAMKHVSSRPSMRLSRNWVLSQSVLKSWIT